MLLDLDAGVEGFGGVAGQDRHGSLGDDGPTIHSVIDEMDGATTLGCPVFDCLCPGVEAGIAREERGMDIDDSACEGIQQGSSQEAHESGQAD